MERIVTKGEFIKTIEAIKKIQEEIRKFTPVISEELKSLSDSDYMSRVCNNSIDYKIRTAKEGDFLFQCSFHNKRYFDRINLLKKSADYNGVNRKKKLEEAKEFKKAEELERLLDSVDKAGVDVNVAGLSKFIIDCPHAGEFLCKLRYYTEPVQGEDHKEKVKDL
jgi:predicted house-cleaning noncanonical NTP pyrophosphatase (MazG superfamily)